LAPPRRPRKVKKKTTGFSPVSKGKRGEKTSGLKFSALTLGGKTPEFFGKKCKQCVVFFWKKKGPGEGGGGGGPKKNSRDSV